MSPKLKYHQKFMTPKTKNLLSLKLKCHKNWNFNKTGMSQKLILHQNWNVTKTDISPKLKYHWNWNVNKTEMSLTLKLECTTGLDWTGLDVHTYFNICDLIDHASPTITLKTSYVHQLRFLLKLIQNITKICYKKNLVTSCKKIWGRWVVRQSVIRITDSIVSEPFP